MTNSFLENTSLSKLHLVRKRKTGIPKGRRIRQKRKASRTKRTIRPKRPSAKLPYRLKEIPIKQIRVWKEAQARSLDREGIKELAKSIRTEGLQNPPLVQREGKDSYLLMAGQRRLAALKRLRMRKVPVLIISKKQEIEDAKAVSVIENLHRRNMNAKDMAKACEYLADTMGKTKGARTLGVSMRTFRKYIGFAAVPDQVKDLVPKVITRDEATKLYQIIPNIKKAIERATKISKYDSPTRKRYLKALSEDSSASHAAVMRKTKKYRAKRRLLVRLQSKQAKGLSKESLHKEMEPEELANKIVSDWLSRRGY